MESPIRKVNALLSYSFGASFFGGYSENLQGFIHEHIQAQRSHVPESWSLLGERQEAGVKHTRAMCSCHGTPVVLTFGSGQRKGREG